MTDFDKEMELPEKGLEGKVQKEVDMNVEKESSLAADQESVISKEESKIKKNNSERKIDDSSTADHTNKKNLDETTEEKHLAHTESSEQSTDKATPVAQAESNSEKAAADTQAENSHSDHQDPESNTADKEKEIIQEAEPEITSDQEVIPEASDQEVIPEASDPSVTAEKAQSNAQDSGKVPGGQETDDPSPPQPSADSEDKENEDQHEEDELDDEEIDYSQLAKDELINVFEKILKQDDIKQVERKVKEFKPFFEEIVEEERSVALKKFIDEGGSEIDFQYVGDALDIRHQNLYEKYKERRNKYYSELEKNKEENLVRKQELLEKLREFVDGEETNTSISALKNIQKEWRTIGPVPSAYAKSLWATYNILIDRFYDNRSIYFELKELDRKKNLEAKLEVCEKAEQLLEYEVIRDAVKELNDLHEEFKHIGPVPAEMQEAVWQRFKSASDAVYERRKEYVSGLKKELHENFDKKKELVKEVSGFIEFDSDKISDWNEKTKEILALQQKWESIGGLPREHAKEINKEFWSGFKSFFNNKNRFFKKLEGQRDENLIKKEALVKRAEELKGSTDWDQSAEILKELQKEWKEIGPVPEKNRNEVYRRFKQACDTFFNRRREHSKEVESEYKVNLRRKEEVCQQIEDMIAGKNKDIEKFKDLQIKFNSIGFVPRNTIKRIQKRYSNAAEQFLNSFDLTESEKTELRFAAEVDKLKSSPNADRKIQKKESEIRRLIGKIENDIALWKNNIEFFAQSKTADKVREEFNDKIEKASLQLTELREELKMLNKI